MKLKRKVYKNKYIRYIMLSLYVIAVVLICSGCINLYRQTTAPISKNHDIYGKFYTSIKTINNSGKDVIYYQFCSDDNAVMWILTTDEIGCIPKLNTDYILTYSDNGTTMENKSCRCSSDIKCECEVYDDIFIKVEEVRQIFN